MVSVLTRAVFRGSFPYGDVERCSTHLPSMCVEPLSVSVCWSKRVRSKSRTNCVGGLHVLYTIGLSMPGKREAFGRC